MLQACYKMNLFFLFREKFLYISNIKGFDKGLFTSNYIDWDINYTKYVSFEKNRSVWKYFKQL